MHVKSNHLHRRLQILFAQRITYWLISLTTKLSILLLYLRLFQVQPTFRALIHLIALLTIAASALGIISFTYRYIVAFTTHASLSVILADPALLRFVLSGAALGFALDCIILCMPLPLVWSMNLNRAKKWSVSGVFLLGGLTCVSSALRIVFIYGVHAHSYQYALEGPSCIWSTVEALLSIVSACLPTLRPLFVWFLQKRQGVGGSGEGGDVGGAEDGAGEVEEGRGRVVELMASKSLQGRQQQGQHRYLSVTSTMLSLTRTSTSMPRPPSPVLTGHASAQATGDSKRPVVDVEAVEADLADTCTGTSTGNVSHGHRKAPE